MNAYQSTAWFVINMILNVLYVGKEEKLSTYEYAFWFEQVISSHFHIGSLSLQWILLCFSSGHTMMNMELLYMNYERLQGITSLVGLSSTIWSHVFPTRWVMCVSLFDNARLYTNCCSNSNSTFYSAYFVLCWYQLWSSSDGWRTTPESWSQSSNSDESFETVEDTEGVQTYQYLHCISELLGEAKCTKGNTNLIHVEARYGNSLVGLLLVIHRIYTVTLIRRFT